MNRKQCDLVMKGGIASGIVYPEAVIELSKHYNFKGIGGTSAGAIAAAFAGAAEYARRNSSDPSTLLNALEHINRFLMGTKGSLLSLFRAQRGGTCVIFQAFLTLQSRWRKVVTLLLALAAWMAANTYLIRHWPWSPLTLGLAPLPRRAD